jgi:hypothetical protein
MILFGTLNLQTIDLINLTTYYLLILTTGVASGHFVSLSMVTYMYRCPLMALGNCSTTSNPHTTNDQEGGIICSPFLAFPMSKDDDTSTGTATILAHCGLLLEGLRFYVCWCCIAVCVSLFKLELNLSCFGSCLTFYSSRSASYMKTWDPIGGPE